MAPLVRRLLGSRAPVRHSISTVDEWLMSFNGSQYPLGLNTTWQRTVEEAAPNSFEAYAQQLFASNPVVFGAEKIRLAVFSQARLKYRAFQNGRPQAPFGNPSLRKFERPWPGGTTLDLLARKLLMADLGGNAYVWDSGRRLHVWRPDWVTIIMGSRLEPDRPGLAEDAEPVGFMYTPGGLSSNETRFYPVDEVAHFAPYPDPLAHFRGMSWMTPIIREVQADKGATEHKWRFFQNAATPNLAIKFDPQLTLEQVRAFKELMESEHQGVANAYKTMYLGGGADPTVIGADFQQLDFAKTQGKGETRILMAAGVHATLAGSSEGLAGSSLNAGNYAQVKRLFADIHMQHLWRNAVASLSVLASPPGDAELWFDTSDIPFLQDDVKDLAEVQVARATAMRQLADGGWDPKSVVDAIQANDLNLLKHTGKLSVQLQPPGSGKGDEANQGEPSGLADALTKMEANDRHQREIERLQRALEEASRPREMRVVRDESGLIVGVEEATDEPGE